MATTNTLSSLSETTNNSSSWPTTPPPPRRPAALRSATGVSPLAAGSGNSMRTPRARHRRAASSPSISQGPSSHPVASSPRFSQLLTTVLGSPFLTTSTDLPFTRSSPEDDFPEVERTASPVPSVDYSVIDMDPNDVNNNSCTNPSIPGSFPLARDTIRRSRQWAHAHTHSRSFSTSMASMNRYDLSSPEFSEIIDPSRPISSLHSTFKALIPKIWDALSSPGRVLSAHLPPSSDDSFEIEEEETDTPSPTRPSTPLSTSWIHANDESPAFTTKRTPSILWNTRNQKGKARATAFFSRSTSQSSSDSSTSTEGFDRGMELDPLDDDEGELIDDEGCFIEVRIMTGIDILSLLPPELSLHILLLLSSSSSPTPRQTTSQALHPLTPHQESLQALLACRTVSHTWRRLSSDNAVWRALFESRWDADLSHATTPEALFSTSSSYNTRQPLGATWDFDWGDDQRRFWESKRPGHPTGLLLQPPSSIRERPVLGRSRSSIFLSPRRISYINTLSSSPLQLDWRVLYRERLELERRWMGTASASSAPSSRVNSIYHEFADGPEESKENLKPFEPAIRRLEGHTDSVYCLEFDSQRIMTGSRDRTIKVWSLHTGKLISTFRGLHRGSVLCLKFEHDWDLPKGSRKGMMVSGSSDCSVCVWELESGVVGGREGEWREGTEVMAEVKTILRGHDGGVLDLRMDDRWIVSCSKDASIRIWDRTTLDCVRTLRGHEGPVNAIGLQGSKIVSASGDGKMILWDLLTGDRIRTFEGHDRGLACIEFKDNLIVSGSNDCKIKVWDPWTGECIRTLGGHEALVRALAFDPRTARLVSVSYDRTVKVWDLRSGKLVREFKRIHASHIFDVKFDVSRIVTTSHDHQIIELDFSGGLDTSLFV